MEPIRIAICDDDDSFRAVMRLAVEDAFYPCSVSESRDAASLGALISQARFDLIFLDIDMPEIDGIALGERLREAGVEADIIYVSNMEDRVYDIFRVHPWSFIRKSRFSHELTAAAAEYIRAREKKGVTLTVQTAEGASITLDPSGILYIEAAGKNQKLFLSDGSAPLLIRASLRELEAKLEPAGFIRIHKGFVVNYRCIRRITSRSVLLDGGGALPIGRDRLNPAREKYLALMKWKGLSRTI